MKLIYEYSNGTTKEHTKFINKNNIKKEAGDSKTVNIYKQNTKLELCFDGSYEGIKEPVTRNKFVTTLLLN